MLVLRGVIVGSIADFGSLFIFTCVNVAMYVIMC